jgi:signal transduction histidine kinase
VQETEGKRTPLETGAIEGDQSGEAGRAPPDAPAQKSWSLLVWGLTLAGVCLVGASLAFASVGLPVPVYPGWTADLVVATPLLVLGGLICARKPQERMGKILLAVGLAGSVQFAAGEYATYSVLGRSGLLFATGAAGWLSSVAQVFLVVGLVVIILLFPTGRLLSPRWRPVAWAVGAGFLGGLAKVAFGGPTFNSNLDFVRNPLYLAHPPGILAALELVGLPVVALGIIGSIAQLVVRLRRSRGEEREQLKWFAYAGGMAPLITLALSSGPLGNIAWTLGPLSLVAAVGIAIFKYRLYDIDVVINKTVVFGGLAAFITAVYVAIVVGIGTAIGQGSRPNLGLSILATGVVAVAFQPVRERVQRFANRLVYGKRATPYEVLSEFSSRMAGAYATEDLLPRMARILAEGTGAKEARVWLKTGALLRSEAAWPEEGERLTLAMRDGEPPEMPEASLVLAVHHRGELLGALSLRKPPGDRLTPAEEHLARDLASGAGLVLRNVRLTGELLARLEDLRASRQRIVAAQDQERRRLERNIHDGAQQQLVALAVKLRLAKQLLVKDPQRANRMLEDVEHETAEALEDLRDLARGIYPPLLADQGLVAALSAQARRTAVRLTVQAEGISRYSPEQEAAVYFCCLEALQNVAKYAAASVATIRLVEQDGRLTFEVQDDGRGFDPSTTSYGTGLQGMADRLSALGGEVEVRSALGHGTTVTGRLPVRALAPVGDS